MQVRHHHHRCVQRVVEAKANAVTVHYSCPGAGQGRTTLRIETRELVQMHTPGVAQSAPFSLALEGRHKGTCHRYGVASPPLTTCKLGLRGVAGFGHVRSDRESVV